MYKLSELLDNDTVVATGVLLVGALIAT